MAALAALVVGAAGLYIEMRFIAPVSSSFAVLVLPLIISPLAAYSWSGFSPAASSYYNRSS